MSDSPPPSQPPPPPYTGNESFDEKMKEYNEQANNVILSIPLDVRRCVAEMMSTVMVQLQFGAESFDVPIPRNILPSLRIKNMYSFVSAVFEAEFKKLDAVDDVRLITVGGQDYSARIVRKWLKVDKAGKVTYESRASSGWRD